MDHLLLLLLLLCSSVFGDENQVPSGPDGELRLVGGASHCAGTLELKHLEEWRLVVVYGGNLKTAAVFCEQLDCGSAVSESNEESTERPVWGIHSECVLTGSHPIECATSHSSSFTSGLVCSDSVRLLDGTRRCSGRLEVKTNQTNQRWASVCEAGFDLQDAEVVCRELGCGAPSVLQGALYEDVQALIWSVEFQCGGHESALLDCRSSGSVGNSCSPAKTVGLTCSDPDYELRLVGGASLCRGTLELKHLEEWRPVFVSGWNLKTAAVFCEHLNCGSAFSAVDMFSTQSSAWTIDPSCVLTGSHLIECAGSDSSPVTSALVCSDSVRLLDGTRRCSGRLEVKTNQTNQRWASVCEAGFDLQDAEVVCRELGCGAPSVLQGALYGDVQALIWSAEFHCGGHESALLDCRSSGSVGNSCSPAKTVGLTCSELDEFKLVGGASRCGGTLELKHMGNWRAVVVYGWSLKTAAVFCEHLDCGSAVSVREEWSTERSAWGINPSCVLTGSHLTDCATSDSSPFTTELVCSDSVRLLDGTRRCSGRLEVKTNQTNQWWASVCETGFDLQDAEVVCRELGCGAPSVLQGALYGDVQAPIWSVEFHCGGHESALLDCRSSGSVGNSCSPAKTVGLTCSDLHEELRLVGGASRCAGTLEMKRQNDRRPVVVSGWNLKTAAVFCEHLDCGSAVDVREKMAIWQTMWRIDPSCVLTGSHPIDCATSDSYPYTSKLVCSDLLLQPNISMSSSSVGVSEAQQQGVWVIMGSAFTISCSIQPQYPGGSFQLTFASSNTSHSSTQTAVNHSAHFLFSAAEPAHQGNYSCVYQVHVFNHSFSSESHLLFLSVSVPTALIIRWVLLPLILILLLQLLISALWFHWKTSRGQSVNRQKNTEGVDWDLVVGAAEGGSADVDEAQEAASVL